MSRARQFNRFWFGPGLAVIVLAIGCAWLSPPPQPTLTPAPTAPLTRTPHPAPPPRVIFTAPCSESTYPTLYTTNGDSSFTWVANYAKPPYHWSPDGTRISFFRGREAYFAFADGSGEVRLSEHLTGDLAWSPDSTRAAFVSGSADGPLAALYLVNADGSGETQAAQNATQYLAWSPDRSKLAFIAGPNHDLSAELHLLNADTLEETRLTARAIDYAFPAWSPDGSSIVFVSAGNLVTINADGSGERQLTLSPTRDISPLWSPDGRRLAFLRRDPANPYWELRVIEADASGVAIWAGAVTRVEAWSPDGSWLYFIDSNEGFYKTNAAGDFRLLKPAQGALTIWSPDRAWIAYEYSHLPRGGWGDYAINLLTGEELAFKRARCDDLGQ